MNFIHHNKQQQKALRIATAIALIFGMWFLKDYFILFVLAIIMSFMFSPVYNRLKRKMRDGTAAGLTLVISFFAILIPVGIVLTLATFQVKTLSTNVTSYITSVDFGDLGQKTITNINNTLDSLPFIDVNITEESVVKGVQQFVQNFGSAFLGYVTSAVSGIVGIVTSSIIYIYIFISVLMHGEKMLDMGKKLNPLGDDASNLYISRTNAMIKGTVRGQFIIALVQGLLAAMAFALVGYGQFFFILFLIFTMFSIIPLGAGILVIPLGVLMILFGNIPAGVIVILEHILINTNVDNILRPVLVPKEARLDPALMLVSVFAGLKLFGFLGIVIGPTIMILIVTTVRMYLDEKKQSAQA